MNNADARQVKGVFVLLALALVAACTATNVPNLPATQPSPVSLTETIPLAAPGVEMPIPAIGGFSGQFSVAPNNAPANTTVTVTSYAAKPQGAPLPQAVEHHMRPLLNLSAQTPIFWGSQKYSNSATFDTFPDVDLQVTSSAGCLYLETFDGATGTLLDQEPGSQSGNSFQFRGSLKSFSVIPGDKYWWELIPGPCPSPSPSAAPSPSPSPSVAPSPSPSPSVAPSPSPSASPCTGSNNANYVINPSGATVAIAPECNFTGTLTYPANNAPTPPAGQVALALGTDVPSVNGGEPAIPPGAQPVVLLSAYLDQTVTFNSGFFALSLTLPNAPPAGTAFYLAVCAAGLSCNSPTTFGPLVLSGQTLTFSGIPGSFTATGSIPYYGQIYSIPPSPPPG